MFASPERGRGGGGGSRTQLRDDGRGKVMAAAAPWLLHSRGATAHDTWTNYVAVVHADACYVWLESDDPQEPVVARKPSREHSGIWKGSMHRTPGGTRDQGPAGRQTTDTGGSTCGAGCYGPSAKDHPDTARTRRYSNHSRVTPVRLRTMRKRHQVRHQRGTQRSRRGDDLVDACSNTGEVVTPERFFYTRRGCVLPARRSRRRGYHTREANTVLN